MWSIGTPARTTCSRRPLEALDRIVDTGKVITHLHRLVLLGLLALTATGVRAAGQMYRFDTVHSQILFSVSHNGFSKALGMLHIKAGWLRFDPEDWSKSATVLDIDLRSVDMGEAQWSATVRGDSLLDAADQPLAHFVSSSVHRTGPQDGLMHGTLTLRGHAMPCIIAFHVNRVGATVFEMDTVAGFSGRAQLDRYAFGISRNPGSIGRMVNVRLEIEAVQDDAARDQYLTGKAAHETSQ